MNTLKQQTKEPQYPVKNNRVVVRTMHTLLDGGFLKKKKSGFGIIPSFVFLAVLGLVYIANNYIAENKVREINSVNRNIKKLVFDKLEYERKINEKTRASVLAINLEKHGIKPLVAPPQKIFIKPEN
jgi:hypothetical protein